MRSLLCLAVLLAACGGGGGGGAPGTRVSSVTPGPGSTAGEPPTLVRVRFDRPVATASIDDQTFLLTWSGGDGIFGNGNDVTLFATTLSFPNSTTALLDLASIPLPDETFRLRLVGTGAAPIVAEDGLKLDGEFTGTFPSGDGAEGGDFLMSFRGTTTVETMTPAPGLNTPAPAAVVVGISDDVDPATVDDTTFRIVRSGGDSNFSNGNEVLLVASAITQTGTQFRFDLSGNALPADQYQVTLAGTGSGAAIRFDGIDDLVRVPPAIQWAPGAGSFTVEGWVEIESASHLDGLVECADGDFSNGWRLRHAADGSFLFSVAGATATRTATGAPASTGWHHVAGVLDTALGETRLYVDGALAAMDSAGAPGAVTPSAALFLGKSGTAFLQGSLDEVRVWSFARTAGDIRRDMYRRLTGSEPLLRAYWRADADIVQFVVDATPAAHTGTLGADLNVGTDDPTHRLSDAWPVVRDMDGDAIDGTFGGTLPAGIGLSGADFVATFRIP